MSKIDAASNIIQILANLPDFLRRPMLQSRVKDFFSMSDENRKETIAMAIEAAPSIDPAKLSVIVKTWLEVISELEPEQKSILFNTYSQEVLSNPGYLQRLDFGSLTRTFMSLNEKQRQSITDSLQETLFAIPNRRDILRHVPEETQRALKLKS